MFWRKIGFMVDRNQSELEGRTQTIFLASKSDTLYAHTFAQLWISTQSRLSVNHRVGGLILMSELLLMVRPAPRAAALSASVCECRSQPCKTSTVKGRKAQCKCS